MDIHLQEKKVVHLVIDGVSARDISETFNPGQAEVIYLPGVKYRVTKVTTANDGFPLIYGEEIVASEIQKLSGSVTSERFLGGNKGVSEGQGDDIRGISENRGSDGSKSESGEVEIHESGTLSSDKERLH